LTLQEFEFETKRGWGRSEIDRDFSFTLTRKGLLSSMKRSQDEGKLQEESLHGKKSSQTDGNLEN
jgi:hypothetical protein